MRFWTILKLALLIGAIWLVWVFWPVYGFYSHRGVVPMPPLGWMENKQGALASYADGHDDAAADADRRLAENRNRIDAPALSAAVSIDGEVVWASAFGWADLKRETQADRHTQFRIGSTSKAITATALARLVDRGVIDLDAPIGTYMKALPNPAWSAITPRMLASHSAGIPHYGYNRDADGLYPFAALKTNFTSMHKAVELFDEAELLWAPGENFEYSSLGTVLLGAVMSEATGKAYIEIIRDEVLEPAGMNNTIIAPMRPGANRDLATFYYKDGDRFREWRPVDLSHRLPGGGFASTPSDLVKMGAKWLDDDYISPQTRAEFWTPQTLNSGEVNEQDYAIGFRWREFEVENAGLARNANHGGVSRGSQFWFMILPDENMSIALAINTKTEEFWTFGSAYEDIFRVFAPVARAESQN